MEKQYKTKKKDWHTKQLPVPIDTMVHEYRLSKEPKKMIDILAEQCETNPCRIAWILARCGMDVDPKKMPRKRPGEEDSPECVLIWEESEDAVICDRIRKQLAEVEAEKGQKRLEAAQSTAVDEAAETVGETVGVVPETVGVVPESACVVPESAFGSGEDVRDAAKAENGGERMTEIVDMPETKEAEEKLAGVGEILAGFWEVYMAHKRSAGITPEDVRHMIELEHIALEMVRGT